MATIQDYLNQIKNAIYGKDVRQAIHDGIRQCYLDGKAGSIDIVAREQLDSLARLEEGSTTGDAELIAGRTGTDNITGGAVTYPTIGDAIRGQVSILNDDITTLKEGMDLRTGGYYAEYQSGYIEYTNINVVVSSSSWKCAKLPCAEGQRFAVKGSGGSASQLWMFFNESGTALTYAGSNVREEDYVVIVAPPTAKYLVVNSRTTEEPVYVGQCIVIDGLRKYTQEGLDVSSFTASAGASDWFWLNSQSYPAGFIDHFVIYGTDGSIGSTAYIAVYDKTLSKFLWVSEGVTVAEKRVVIPCNVYFENDIYVCARLPHMAHSSTGNTVQYANMWEFAVWSEGAVFDIDWKSASTTFKFAIECWYDDEVNLDNLHYAKAKNRMFVAGDSITAGYPYTSGISRPNYYDPDIRWGAQVARNLGFTVTFGAQTGAGWLYRPSSSAQYAISIADNNNFSNYDTVVFAFGTNDYGNNMPLGEVTDVYPAQQTVCGAMNYVIRKIFMDNPKAVLIISSPINRSDKGVINDNFGYGTPNTQGYTLLELLNKMKEVCTSNGVCFIDNSNSPFNKYSLEALLMDNLHPSPEGYKILGSFLSTRIANFVTPYTRGVLTNKN